MAKKVSGRGARRPKRATALATRDWHGALAQLIGAIGGKGFPALLDRALAHVVAFDHLVTFAYLGAGRPHCLHDNFKPTQRRIFVTMYVAGPYLLDPFFQACRDGRAEGLYRMRDVAPDRFYQSEYYRSYYAKTGLAEEIGLMFHLPGGVKVVISLMRAGGNPQFSDHDLRRLRIVEPVIRAAAQKHWQSVSRSWDDSAPASAPSELVDGLLRDRGPSGLTPRESDVVSLVLKGHSSDSIGRLLGISAGTAKIHRKNIYRKLGISSQSELFALFLGAIQQRE